MVRKGNVLNPKCPSRQVLERVGEKWSALVLRVLADGTYRYSDLQRRVGGVSQKMLTQTLRGLERDGLVARHAYPVVPPRVEYSLTPKGEALVPLIEDMRRYGREFLGVDDCAVTPPVEPVAA